MFSFFLLINKLYNINSDMNIGLEVAVESMRYAKKFMDQVQKQKYFAYQEMQAHL